MKYSSSRLEALSDGIIAIVATILVLVIEVPEMDDPTRYEVVQWFDANSHVLWAYAVSFLISGNYWWLHNLIFEGVHNTDQWFTLANLIFLMVLALIPFSTHFLIELAFTDVEFIAELFYGVNQISACLCLLFIRSYALRNKHILSNMAHVKDLGKLLWINCGIYIVALAIMISTSTFVLFIYLVIPLTTFIVQHFVATGEDLDEESAD